MKQPPGTFSNEMQAGERRALRAAVRSSFATWREAPVARSRQIAGDLGRQLSAKIRDQPLGFRQRDTRLDQPVLRTVMLLSAPQRILDLGPHPVELWPGCRYLSMRLILEPSKVRLYIRPFWSKMKPTIGLVMLLVSITPPTPMAITVIDPSMPTFHPSVA